MSAPGTAWVSAAVASLPRAAAHAVAAPVLLPGRVLGLLDEVSALVADLRGSAARVQVLLDELEEVPAAVLSLVGEVGGRAGEVIDDLQVTVAGVQPTLAVLHQAQALLAAVSALDPDLVAEVVELVHVLPPLVERIDSQVLPAVAALEGLVPVVAKLSVTVDSLDHQVVEVGSLLGGIPGASRLLKRGERDARQRAIRPDAPA